jgi:hypothetical protein
MAAFYTYLISSLPMLQLGVKPGFSSERFLAMCRDLIPEKDWQVLELSSRETLLEQNSGQPTLKQWMEFEAGLRNELVKIRSSRKKIDPAKYLRRDGYSESSLYHIALNSHRIPSLVDAEKFLDQQRWLKLEELSFGHYFDLDALIIYCLKLRILWRWENIAQADKQDQLARVLAENHSYSEV